MLETHSYYVTCVFLFASVDKVFSVAIYLQAKLQVLIDRSSFQKNAFIYELLFLLSASITW